MAYKVFLSAIAVHAPQSGLGLAPIAQTKAVIFDGDEPVRRLPDGYVYEWYASTRLRGDDVVMPIPGNGAGIRERLLDEVITSFENTTHLTGTYDAVWMDKLW